MHESFDGLLGVEHSHVGSLALEVVELLLDGSTTVIGDKPNVGLSWLVDNLVLASVLVTISVSTNDNGLSPAWHQSWDVFADNSLSEHSSIKNVSDSSIG